MRILVSDIGYGDTKYIFLDGESESKGKIPTLVAPVMKSSYELGENSSLSYGGRNFLAGPEAKYASYVIPTTTREFLMSYSPLLVARVLRELEEMGGIDLLVVSLSLKDWRMKNEIEKVTGNFTVSNRTYSQEVKVFPQGLGIWVECGRPENVAIVDIGYNTIDVPVFMDGRINRELSFAIAGMGTTAFISEVTDFVNSNFKEDFTPNEICHFMQTESPYFQRLGIVDEIKSRSVDWFNDVWERLTSRQAFRKVVKYMDVIIAGGGARFALEAALDANVKVFGQAPEFANVMGFAKEIRREMGEG